MTSAATPFTASELGNLIHITSGVNFTNGFYELVSIVGAVVTLDRSPGTLAATGGTGRVGGALTSPNDTPAIQGGIVWLQGSFTTGVQWVLNDGVGDGNFVTHLGYSQVRGDNGLATVTATGALSPIITQANQVIVRNLKIDGANLANRGINFGIDCYTDNLWVTRCGLSGLLAQNEGTRVRRCLFTFCGAGAASGVGANVGTGSIISECEAHDCMNGFSCSNGTGDFVECVAHHNTASGFFHEGDDGFRLRNCTSDANTLDGLRFADGGDPTLSVINCLFTNNGGKGINSVVSNYSTAAAAQMAVLFQHNAFYNNTGGNYGQVPLGVGDVLLTADPYVDAANRDYSANGVAGGGAAILGAGVPGGFGLVGTGSMPTTGHRDIGAWQTLGAAPATSALVTMRSLWRELTGERFSTVTDAIVDTYLDLGQAELNRRIHYFVKETSLAITAGVQEIAVPEDYVADVFLRYGSFRVLQKFDIEKARGRGEDWANEPAGEPAQYATYSNKIVLRPVPSAEAVAAAATVTLRHVATPPSITGNGPLQLGTQDHKVAVYWGAYVWSMCYPDSQVAIQRAQGLRKDFDDGAQAIIGDYARRNLST